MAGEDITELPRDCVLCTYHLMLSQKIKKRFGLSEVSTLTPADASGPTVDQLMPELTRLMAPPSRCLSPYGR